MELLKEFGISQEVIQVIKGVIGLGTLFVLPFQKYLDSPLQIVLQHRHASTTVSVVKVVRPASDYLIESVDDYLFRQRVVPPTSQLSYLCPDPLHGFL